MAVRFDTAGEDYVSTTPATAPYTVILWGRIDTDRNDFSTFWSSDSNSTTKYHILQTGSDGTTIKMVGDGGFGTITGPNATVGNWYRLAVTLTAAVDLVTLYWGDPTGSLSSSSADILTGTALHTRFRIGASPFSGEWLDGSVAALKHYSAVLTQAEIETELAQYRPVRTANLVRFHPFINSETVDYSGNANTLTGGTGAAREDGPPIPWGSAAPLIILPASAQSVAIDQAVELDSAGSITPIQVVAIEQAAEQDTAGAITPVQLVLIDQAIEADSAGTVTPTQLVLIDQAAEQDAAGSITPLQVVVVDQAVELDSAGLIAPVQLVLIGQAAEADSAGIIAPPAAPVTPWPPRAGSITVTGVATATVTVI